MTIGSTGMELFLSNEAKLFVFAVELSDPVSTTTHEIVSSPPANSGDFISGTKTLVPLAMMRQGEPWRSKFSINTFTFRWLDTDGEATTAIGVGIVGWTCKFYVTGWDMSWSTAKIQLFTGKVSDVDLEEGNYKITVRSAIADALSTRLFDAASTELSHAINATQASCIVKNANAMQSTGVFAIGTERVTYTGKIDNGDTTWTLNGLGRGAGTSTAATHAADAAVQEIFILTSGGAPGTKDNALDILTDVLTNTGAKNGFNLDSAWLDTTGIAAVKSTLGTADHFSFEGTTGRNGKEWLEEEIFAMLASYPVENNLGQIRPKLFDTPTAADFVETFTDADVLARPVFEGNFEHRVNDLILDLDQDVVNYDGSFANQQTLNDASLITLAGGKRHTMHLESTGMRGATLAATKTFIDGRLQATLDRFGNRVPVLTFNTKMSKLLLEIGDPVLCTFTNVLNIAMASSATRAITNGPFEIIGIRVDFQRMNINYKVLGYPGTFVGVHSAFVPGESHTSTGLKQSVA